MQLSAYVQCCTSLQLYHAQVAHAIGLASVVAARAVHCVLQTCNRPTAHRQYQNSQNTSGVQPPDFM